MCRTPRFVRSSSLAQQRMCKECLLKWRSDVSWSCSQIATVLSQTLGDLHPDSFRICLSSRHPERSNSKHYNSNALSDVRLALLEEIFPAHQNYTITPWKWIKQQTTQALLLTACHCIQSAWLQTPQCIWTTAPLSAGRPVYYGEWTPAEQCRFPFHFFLTLCSSSCSGIMAILFPDSWCHRLSHYSGHTNIWNEKEKKREEEEEGRKVPSPGSTGGLDLTDPLLCSVDLWLPESRATVTDCGRMTPRLLLGILHTTLTTSAHSPPPF